MIDYWKSSIPSFSSFTSFRPLLSVSGRTKKWSSEAAPDFAPPRQEPFARAHFNAFKESSKAAYDYAIHLMSSSGAAGHAVAYAAARVGAMRDFLILAAFSSSSSCRPLSSALVRAKKCSGAAASDFAPSQQEPFA